MTNIDRELLEFAGWKEVNGYWTQNQRDGDWFTLSRDNQSAWCKDGKPPYYKQEPTIDLNFLFREVVPKLMWYELKKESKDGQHIAIAAHDDGEVLRVRKAIHHNPTEALKQAIVKAIRRNDAGRRADTR